MTIFASIAKSLQNSLLIVGVALLVSACASTTIDSKETGLAAYAVPDKYAAIAVENVLRSGGNAVDAAVAAAFVLAVTFPEAGNIGGGGFLLARMDGEAHFLDYREKAPLKADRDMYLDEQGEVVEKASLVGIRAAGVPGTVAGMWEAHKNWGPNLGQNCSRQRSSTRVMGLKYTPRRRPTFQTYLNGWAMR